jgi:hypothetical protein
MAKETTVIQLQFVRGKGLSSRAIAWFGGGRFSHVDAIMPNGTLIGARSDVIHPLGGGNPIPAGVQPRPAGYEAWEERIVASLTVDKVKADKFYKLNQSQIGKQYDVTAIWGFVTGRDWRDPQDWFCSELQAWCLETPMILPQLFTPVNKISPSTLAFGLSTAGATFKP